MHPKKGRVCGIIGSKKQRAKPLFASQALTVKFYGTFCFSPATTSKCPDTYDMTGGSILI
jgi:hypothetical protein